MAFSSVHEMIDLCKESGKPLYEVILESDLAESGLTRAESEAATAAPTPPRSASTSQWPGTRCWASAPLRGTSGQSTR